MKGDDGKGKGIVWNTTEDLLARVFLMCVHAPWSDHFVRELACVCVRLI